MKVCKCDRCGKVFEPRQYCNGFYSRTIQTGLETFDLMEPEADIDNTYDICEDCYESFKKWIHRGALEQK